MLFCRFGGEEFALFAPGRDMANAEPFAEDLRRAVAALPVHAGEYEIAVSVSIGLADVATFGADFDRLHSAADGALYAAKEAGRNQVKRAAPPLGLSGIAERMKAPAAADIARTG